MKKILIFLFSLQVIAGLSQSTNISGIAIGHPNELVRILIYADQFSRLDSTLAVSQTDIWGNFSLPVPVEEPSYAFLALGLKRGSFYVNPGNDYQVQILDDTTKGSVFDQIPLQFNLYSETDSLNQLIGRFNYKYNVFLYEKQREIMRSKDKRIIKEFVNEMKAEFISESLESDNYLRNYVNYSLAAIEWISKSEPDSAILMDYFINKKVLHENIAYTDFFRDYFKEYFNRQKYYRYDELVNAINSESIYNVDSLLRRDQLLILNNELRELSLVLLLARHYHHQDVSKKAVIKLYRQIELQSIYDKNKDVAKNFRTKLSHLNYGSEAPTFQLPDQYGEIVQLTDLGGQFVLLDFISSQCGPCFFDLKRLQEVQQNISDSLTIVLIVTDGNIIETKAWLDEDYKGFVVLNLDSNILILENYQVRTYPAYVLINPDGTIAMAPAPPPNENLGHFIEGFITRYKRK